jgi:hypothetical protein
VEQKYTVPAATMGAAVAVWIALLVASGMGDWVAAYAPWSELAVGLVVGGTVVFSGVSCRRVGGPRIGQIVRTGLLLVMAAITYFWIGGVAATVLVACSLFTVAMALASPPEAEPAG